MSKRPARMPGMPWLIPYMTVKDADAAVDFCQRAFGFEKRMAMPGPDGRTAHAEVTYKDMIVMFGPEGAYGNTMKCPASSGTPSGIALYLYTEDVDALFARATKAGAKADLPPTDMFYGDRVCKMTDPDGYAWSFATNVADFDPSKAPK